MKYKLIFVTLSIVLWVGCYEEDSLTPTETGELKYSVPQGDHDYDQKIVDWNERSGFYILYKYEPKDIYWNVNSWNEVVYDSVDMTTKGTIKAELPDENYVGKQLEFLEWGFLNFYQDTMLRRCMPMKLLLAKNLKKTKSFNNLIDLDVCFGFNEIVLSHGDQTIDTLAGRHKELIKDTINILFLSRLRTQEKVAISKVFADVSKAYYDQTAPSGIYEKGFVNVDRYLKRTKVNDWDAYVQAIVKTPYSVLIEEPADGDTTFKGILNAKKDTKNLIRAKYNIIIDYFKREYGLDLQAIGNARSI